jgi:hypothetical protein
MVAEAREVTTTAQIIGVQPDAEVATQRVSSWIVELLLRSAHMVCLACPLCGRLNTEACVLCGSRLCPIHDLACRVVSEVMCQSCWRSY